ncbi:MAG TPA: hypothetical protein V6C96_02995, partial [Vampirovibrionales bacterium]
MTKTTLTILSASIALGISCSPSPKELDQESKTLAKSYVDETPSFYSDTLVLTQVLDSMTENEKLVLFKKILPKAKKTDDYSSFSSSESIQVFQRILALMQIYQDSSANNQRILQSYYKKILPA